MSNYLKRAAPSTTTRSAVELFMAFDEGEEEPPQKRAKTTNGDDEISNWSSEDDDDWTILISIIDEEQQQPTASARHYRMFEVPKSILAAKSEYFVSLFRTSFQESDTSISEIDLPELAFHAFPIMLEFIADGAEAALGARMQRTADDLVGLRYLSQYFSIRSLFEEASTIIKVAFKDQLVANSMMISAEKLHDDNLVALIVDRWALRCVDLGMGDFSPTLALCMFEAEKQAENDEYLSVAVAEYCMKRRNDIDAPYLRRATMYVHDVSYSVAPYLLSLALELDGEDGMQLWYLRKLCRDAFLRLDGWYLQANRLFETEAEDEARDESWGPPAYDDWIGNLRALGDSERATIMENIASTLWKEHQVNREKIDSSEIMCRSLQTQIRSLDRTNFSLAVGHRRMSAAYEQLRAENDMLNQRLLDAAADADNNGDSRAVVAQPSRASARGGARINRRPF